MIMSLYCGFRAKAKQGWVAATLGLASLNNFGRLGDRGSF